MNDLFTDLADGKLLMKLLEIISGETLGRPNKGVLRVQKVENVNRCLVFLRTKVGTTFSVASNMVVSMTQRSLIYWLAFCQQFVECIMKHSSQVVTIRLHLFCISIQTVLPLNKILVQHSRNCCFVLFICIDKIQTQKHVQRYRSPIKCEYSLISQKRTCGLWIAVIQTTHMLFIV